MMDRITRYKEILKQELEKRAAIKVSYSPHVKNHLIINEEETDSMLLRFGWMGHRYRYLVVFHFQIIGDKIWLHQNNIDVEIGEILAEKGIPKSSTVIGFVGKLERGLEGYAAA
ncbi:MAG: element excision factor XisI family protein [Bacteroidota bacterium]